MPPQRRHAVLLRRPCIVVIVEGAQLAAAIQASLESANHVHREPFDEVTSDVELKAAIAASLAESKTAAVSRESVD